MDSAELKELKDKIAATESKAEKAEADGNVELQTALVSNLAELRKERNLLLQQQQPGASSLEAVVSGLEALREGQQVMWEGQQVIQASIAEHFSRTRQASKIRRAELETLTTALKCRLVWAEGDPSLEELLGLRSVEDADAFWDEDLIEPAQREAYAKELQKHIPVRRGCAAFDLHDVKGQTVKTVFEGVPYPVAARNDEMVSLRRFKNDPLHGGILGVELKKELSWAAVRQAEAEYVLFATTSWYPYCQVATDLKKGGIAFYSSGEVGGLRVITGRVFQDMEGFWKFFSLYLDSFPTDIASDERLFVDELSNPKRLRLHLEVPTQSGDDTAAPRVHAALRTLARMFNNWGDVANVADLQGFEELGTPPAVPFYIS